MKDTKKETLSHSNSSSNMFSMLSQNPECVRAGDAGGPSKYSNHLPRKTSVDLLQWKKLALLSRMKPLKESASPPLSLGSCSDNEGPDVLAAESSMTESEALKKITEDTKEFFAVRNLDEAEVYFTTLSVEHQFRLVDKLVMTAIESKKTDAQLVARFFGRVVAKELCGGASFEEGFMPTADLLDEIVFDAPKAFELMAVMMKGAGLDKDEGRRTRIAGKSKDGEKLLDLLLA
jgi:translation initiation factor 4G